MKSGLRAGLVLALALTSLFVTKLALFVALFVLLSALTAPKAEPTARRRYAIAHLVAGVIAFGAVGRFLATDALAGIVEGGTAATGAQAVSRLREILFGEDAARKLGSWDPDHDGVGSALLIAELTGELGMRGGPRLNPPLLEGYPKVEPTSLGSAVDMGGFWFAVCVPARSGELVAEPSIAVDDERAERRFVAYAWPNGRAPGLTRAYFLDEHERILVASAKPGRRYAADHAPGCDDALAPATRDDWAPWRGKKPREGLPGEHPSGATR